MHGTSVLQCMEKILQRKNFYHVSDDGPISNIISDPTQPMIKNVEVGSMKKSCCK